MDLERGDSDLVSDLNRTTERFQTRFIQVTTASMGLIAMIVGPLALLSDSPNPTATTSAIAVGLMGCSYYMAHSGRTKVAARLCLYGMLAALSAATLAKVGVQSPFAITAMGTVLMFIASFILGGREAAIIGGATATVSLTASTIAMFNLEQTVAQALVAAVLPVMVVGLATTTAILFVNQAIENENALQARLHDVDGVVRSAKLIAAGDLTVQIDGDSDVSDVLRLMLTSLRKIVGQIRQTASTVSSSSTEIAAMARQQERGATEQAGAVIEVRRSMESLLVSSGEIADSANEVLTAVDTSKQANDMIAERLGELTAQTQRISEVLAVIKDIANKSDLLALNASLEGTRAGEAGQGFSLVANRMQRLAEDVATSVRDIKKLNEDIRESTSATVASAQAGIEIAASLSQATGEISMITRQQRGNAEKVAGAINEIADASQQILASNTQTLQATESLADLSKTLDEAVEGFRS